MSDDAVTQSETEVQQDAPDELALARALVLRAYPDVVHELVVGQTLAELLESVPSAEAAYRRVADATRTATVPGGGAVRSVAVELDGLSPLAKIRTGLQRS